MFLATCCVMVEAPIGRRPCPICVMSNTAARGDRQRIDPGMRPEILILGRDEGLLHQVRNRRIRHKDAALGGKLSHQPSVAGVNPAHHRRLVIAQPIDVRQVGGETLPGDITADAADRDRQQTDAEQPANDATRKAADQAAAWLAGRWRLPFAALAAVGRGGRQLLAGCQGLVHKTGDMALFREADQRRER